jgi:hypothetical protein
MIGALCGNSVMNYVGACSEISIYFDRRIIGNFLRGCMSLQDR